MSKEKSKVVVYFSPSRLDLLMIYILRMMGVNVYIWTTSRFIGRAEEVPFPEASFYVEIMEKARRKIDDYFSGYFEGLSDAYIEDYLRKFYDLKMIEYTAFRHSVDQLFGDDAQVFIKDSTFQRVIYECNGGRSRLRGVYLLLFAAANVLFIARSLLRNMRATDKVAVEKVVYVRKKPYPDLGLRDIISEELEGEYGIKTVGAYIYDSSQREKLGNYFINAFEGSGARVKRASTRILQDAWLVAGIGSRNGLDYRMFMTLLADMYRANLVMLLDASIYFGVLVDKPMFILLSRYKNNQQKILGINESFMYPPFRSFDYNHLDVYYSMNEIDWGVQNRYGGEIKTHKNVDFFRKSLRTYAAGISDELKELYERYGNMVIAAPIQVSETGFTQWGAEELIGFIRGCVDLAKSNKDYLFVIKGKKNELSHLPSEMIEEMDKLENVFVIFSVKPRELKYNQFEDLLKYTTLLISMSHTSTTIWQALSNNIPVIAVNDVHSPSFLSEYDFLESRSDQLAAAFKYWTEKDPTELEVFIDQISDRVNLGSGAGLMQIANDISAIYKDKAEG